MFWFDLQGYLKYAITEFLDENGILGLFQNVNISMDDIEIPITSAKKSGYQYQSIIPIILFNMAKKNNIVLNYKNALEFAEDISKYLPKSSPFFEIMDILVTGAGYLNFRMLNFFPESILGSDGILSYAYNMPIPIDPHEFLKNKLDTIIVDFSSPNIAKPLHVGHLRSTIIGDVISNLYEYKGYNVIRQNHLGDWGTPIGKLMQMYLEKNQKKSLDEFQPDEIKNIKLTISDIGKLYTEASEKFKNDLEFQKCALSHVVKLQNDDSNTLLFWDVIYKVSICQLESIYEKLKIRNNYQGESTYSNRIKECLDNMAEHMEQSDDGRVIFNVGLSSPLIIRKSDGSYTYDTTDLVALDYRMTVLNADRVIYVVDNGQSHHFQQVFRAIQKHYNFNNTIMDNIIHKKFGLVLGPDGKKISSRSLNSTNLEDDPEDGLTLESFIDYAESLVFEKFWTFNLEKYNQTDTPEGKQKFYNENRKKISTMTMNSIKFYELSFNSHTSYTFNPKDMLSDKGRTAFYLNYGYVRMLSIIRKIENEGYNRIDLVKKIRNKECLIADGETPEWKVKRNTVLKDGSYEVSPLDCLMHHLMTFNDVVETVIKNLDLNLLADFYYNMISLTDHWYENYRCMEYDSDGKVIGINWSRLAVVELVIRFSVTLNQLLGLEMVEQI
uniref:arginine--tRNA ligase n=1 Tax=viral metagenome TaxID=1070528 RepID=A0A6C0E6T6_9ZZZZ